MVLYICMIHGICCLYNSRIKKIVIYFSHLYLISIDIKIRPLINWDHPKGLMMLKSVSSCTIYPTHSYLFSICSKSIENKLLVHRTSKYVTYRQTLLHIEDFCEIEEYFECETDYASYKIEQSNVPSQKWAQYWLYSYLVGLQKQLKYDMWTFQEPCMTISQCQ